MVLSEDDICGGQFWKKVGYTLDDTMREEIFGVGYLTLEDTME